MKLRKLVLRAFTPEAIRNIVPDIQSIAKDSLLSWEGRLINTFQEMKSVSFYLFFFFPGSKQSYSVLPSPVSLCTQDCQNP